MKDSTDREIWEFAKIKNFVVVTFDSDFVDIANLKGHPPKIIWLRIGNTTTSGIAELLNTKADYIKDFIHNKEYQEIACLELG